MGPRFREDDGRELGSTQRTTYAPGLLPLLREAVLTRPAPEPCRTGRRGDREGKMDEKQTDWEEFAAVSSNALRVRLEPEWKAAVASNLRTIFNIAAVVDGFPLPDDAEPAPVFEA